MRIYGGECASAYITICAYILLKVTKIEKMFCYRIMHLKLIPNFETTKFRQSVIIRKCGKQTRCHTYNKI